ncbi:MAG: DsrE/DsrF/DrsH-like family protein [Erysipelotrichaceae bacterium]
MKRKIVIVGGVAGGATAAARLRRLSETDEIILFEKDEYISFANCGLPYYIGGVITEREKLIVQSVEGMRKRFALDIRNFSEVIKVDQEHKKVVVKNHRSQETYEESYDVLILSPGAKPMVPAFEGIEAATNLFVLRNIPDTDAIDRFIKNNKAKTAVVVGGGFIGVEMAENLVERGLDVKLVEKMPQVLAPLDFEMAQMVHETLEQHGVVLHLNTGVTGFSHAGTMVHLDNASELQADIVILAIGVSPNSKLASDAGFACGPRGHMLVNDTLQLQNEDGSYAQDVYAIGDAIEVVDFVSGSKTAIPLAWPANRQGRVVADIIHGRDARYPSTLGTSVLKVFDQVVATTGNNERMLKQKNMAYQALHAHRGNHAGYYPNAKNIALKVLFDPTTGTILGAQAVGGEGSEKRIDVIATVISLHGKIQDLSALELSYAPPFSSAKDPVNVVGYIGENLLEQSYRMAYAQEVSTMQSEGVYFLDVRTPLEFSLGHIASATNIDVDTLRDNLYQLPQNRDTKIVVNCQVGFRAYLAIQILKAHGYTNLFNLSGGYTTYRSFQYVSKKTTSKPTQAKPILADNDNQSVVSNKPASIVKRVDVCGLQCPGPLLSTYQAIQSVNEGERVEIIATDFGFANDVKKWCETNAHQLVGIKQDKKQFVVTIEKGNQPSACLQAVGPSENATIVLFSGELDKALAAMVIAQGAAAQGKKVTIFFTFWGLNALRKAKAQPVKKTLIEKMFGFMMPKGSTKLPLSNMDMFGAGRVMIKGVMKDKNIDSLEVMMQKAQALGVNFMACTMSMDMMGIKKEELWDDISYGGVGSYIGENEKANTTLFI